MSGFVDEAQLNVRGGDGGAGCVSFRREGPVAFGGPNGGDGGKGGDIWLAADRNVASLIAFRDHPHRSAPSGVHGQGKDQHGKRGKDLRVAVPEGTVITDLYSGELLADLANHGDRWLAAAGGRGGRGNAKFLSNRRRAPTFAEQGEHGEERWLKLELKLMADVALVGFPNVGKSTLISVISAAKPKIADYPFTTLEPNLGVVRLDEHTEFVVADIPGLIEGASEGRGLGHRFLKHIERSRVLCVLADLSDPDGPSPDEQERILLGELQAYQPELLDRPRVVVGSKSDSAVHDWDGLRLSAVTHQGVRELVGRMAALVHEARQAEPVSEGIVILRPQADGARVERMADREFRLIGRQVERVVALNDVTTPEALSYIDYQLKRLGVPRMLSRAGAHDGDVVWIAAFSFEYHEEICVRVVAKIGTSSLTDALGVIQQDVIDAVCDQLAALRRAGHEVILVSSGAVSAGVAALGLTTRPHDVPTLQAISAAGQSRLMETYNRSLGRHGLVAAQMLFVPHDFVDRRQYLHARRTLVRLLELGCIPIANENDALASDEIRYGDNDRIATLVAHNVAADLLVLLTDTPGLYTADPRTDAEARLIEVVPADDALLSVAATTAGSSRGSGGMASKLSAARMASWAGVRAVIAHASRPNVLVDAVSGEPVGTTFLPSSRTLPARKLWIGFATNVEGAIVVDDGARRALVERGTSLLPAGVVGVTGDFAEGDVVEVHDSAGASFARGIALVDASVLRRVMGKRTSDLPSNVAHEAIHRDDLLLLV